MFNQTIAAAAANMCPHCHALVGNRHLAGCPDGEGRVGMPSMASKIPTYAQFGQMTPVLCLHKKTGNYYLFMGTALECSAGREDTLMALYVRIGEPDLPMFTRELNEFWERFDRVAPESTSLKAQAPGMDAVLAFWAALDQLKKASVPVMVPVAAVPIKAPETAVAAPADPVMEAVA